MNNSKICNTKVDVPTGIDLNDKEAQGILEMVRAASVRLKRTLFDKELVKLYKEYHSLNM